MSYEAVFLIWQVADPEFMMQNFTIVHKFGPKFLLKLYLAGAIAGSSFFLLERASIKDGSGDSEIPMLGASAAVTAIVLLDLFYIPTKKKYSLLEFIMYSASILLRGEGGSVHLGGAAVAAIVCARLMMKKHL
ncbi:hypothetical protein CTI12_AA072230 [Artemisia annua]|uniref:Peptidase S54 rhomboid domain-containing protein n=1 Tax=Artemisia annua TaxID=35608 RepID=A0A2U1Q604_ARTAN|nr:hypothetical protein CTI12_AA072230 [Artemisia annua]